METLQGFNKYTTDPKKWVELLNRTTSEWTIGYLPSNLVAIPGALNDSVAATIPPGSLVIEHAAKADLGSRAVEKVVFGVTAGIVILWGCIWIGLNFAKLKKLLWDPSDVDEARTEAHERRPLSVGDTNSTAVTDNNGLDPDGEFSAKQFGRLLRQFYYDGIDTELELHEKDATLELLDEEDVEDVTTKLRRMYDLDLGLWGFQGATHVQQSERDRMRSQSQALWSDVRAAIDSWQPGPMGATTKESATLANIKATMSRISPQRYE